MYRSGRSPDWLKMKNGRRRVVGDQRAAGETRVLKHFQARMAGVCAWPLGLTKAGRAGFRQAMDVPDQVLTVILSRAAGVLAWLATTWVGKPIADARDKRLKGELRSWHHKLDVTVR
jgi:hypothetical protein